MKFTVIILLICASLSYAQPNVSGTDFLVDNILKPLLTDIKENSLTFLQQMLLNMIPGIGKRDVDLTEAYHVCIHDLIQPLLTSLHDLLSQTTDSLIAVLNHNRVANTESEVYAELGPILIEHFNKFLNNIQNIWNNFKPLNNLLG